MKKIIAMFIAIAMITSFGIGVIAGADADTYANAVLEEEAQLTLEKAAVEFANGNDVEGLAAEDDATNNFGKTELGFHKLAGAVITASYFWGCGSKLHKPRPTF